jgi:hypothetical protein
MKKKVRIRTVIQILFFVLIALIAVNHTLAESGMGIPLIAEASLHAVCPFGGVVSIYQLITGGTFVKKVHESSMVSHVYRFCFCPAAGPSVLRLDLPFWYIPGIPGKAGEKNIQEKI